MTPVTPRAHISVSPQIIWYTITSSKVCRLSKQGYLLTQHKNANSNIYFLHSDTPACTSSPGCNVLISLYAEEGEGQHSMSLYQGGLMKWQVASLVPRLCLLQDAVTMQQGGRCYISLPLVLRQNSVSSSSSHSFSNQGSVFVSGWAPVSCWWLSLSACLSPAPLARLVAWFWGNLYLAVTLISHLSFPLLCHPLSSPSFLAHLSILLLFFLCQYFSNV